MDTIEVQNGQNTDPVEHHSLGDFTSIAGAIGEGHSNSALGFPHADQISHEKV